MFKLSFNSKMAKLADMLGLHKNQIACADMPCGYTCPMADKCQAFSDRKTGKITAGVNSTFRCYGVNLESAFTNTRKLHWNNFDVIKESKTIGKMTDTILAGMRDNVKILRIHSFGDFFNENYFKAWLNVTEKLPHISFFAYTKVLPFLKVSRPDNFSMVYSYGGKLDNLRTDEPTAYVLKNEDEAKKLGVPIACQKDPADDYNFILAQKSFGILLHGQQPKKITA